MVEILKGTNRFYIGDPQRPLGYVTYRIMNQNPKLWILDHTFVDPSLRGQRVGNQLVAKVVEQARLEKAKIIPLCSFALFEFQRKPDYADVYDAETDPGEGATCNR